MAELLPADAAHQALARRGQTRTKKHLGEITVDAGANNVAEVAELADAHASEACARKGVEVQVLSSAQCTKSRQVLVGCETWQQMSKSTSSEAVS